MGTVILIIYLAGCMIFLIPTARFFFNDLDGISPPDTMDYVMSASMALCIVWVWPAYIPGWWIVQMLKQGEKKPKR